MKVSVITLHTSINYGSVLQTYATQKTIEKLGHTVEFVDYCRPNNTEEAQVEKTFHAKSVQLINKCTFGILKPFLLKIVRRRVKKRSIPMETFLTKYINCTKDKYFSLEEIEESVPQADVYMTGSDQVWNSQWNGGIDQAYFLAYVPDGKRKVAYASSIGQETVPIEELQVMKNLLKDFAAISVREKTAVDILASIGIDAQLVLDPTLMIEKEEWLSIAKEPKCSYPYLLMYQLNSNEDMDKYALRIAEKKHLRVIKVRKNPSFINRKGKIQYLSLPSVEELIGYFANADMVLTDSFHGTAFSINLGLNFLSVRPPRFSTRIESVLQMFGMENRMLENYKDVDVCERKIDWENAKIVLTQMRQDSYSFLRKAISSI